MSVRRSLVIALAVLCGSSSALAQEDDLLAPLTPSKEAPKAKKKKAPPKKSKPKPAEDDMLAPLAIATELLVTVGGGVQGATLSVDGKNLGAAVGKPVEVKPGTHEVTVRRPGYADRTVKVTVDEGEREELRVELQATHGVVSVASNVAGARVKIDGKEHGVTPLAGLLLTPGDHEVWVEHDDYLPEVSKLSVRAGNDYAVDVALEPVNAAVARRPKLTPSDAATTTPSPLTEPSPEPLAKAGTPWYGRWYVWAGAAAVVAAAAGGTYAAMNSHGPLSPTQVCGGVQCDGTVNGLRVPVGAGQF